MSKRPSAAILIITLSAVTAVSMSATEPMDQSAEADLRATIEELRTASVKGDTQEIVASMTDDY